MTKNKLAEKRVIKYVIYLILCLANSYVAILFIYALEGCFKKEPIEREEKTDFKQTAYLALGIVAIFMAIISFYYSGLESSIRLNNIVLISSWEILLCMIFPLTYLFRHKREKKKIDGKLLLLTLFPLIINDVYRVINVRMRYFSLEDSAEQILFALISAALFEELFFRGYIYNKLKIITSNTVVSQVVSSLIFSVWHIGLILMVFNNFSRDILFNLVNIFFLGLVCSIAYEKSDNIIIPIIIHAVNNSILFNLFQLSKTIIILGG